MADLISMLKSMETRLRKLEAIVVRQNAVAGISGNRVTTNVNYTALVNDSWIIAIAPCTIFLYATPADNQQIDVTTDAKIKIDGNGNNINGAASFKAFPGESFTMRYDPDSGQWRII